SEIYVEMTYIRVHGKVGFYGISYAIFFSYTQIQNGTHPETTKHIIQQQHSRLPLIINSESFYPQDIMSLVDRFFHHHMLTFVLQRQTLFVSSFIRSYTAENSISHTFHLSQGIVSSYSNHNLLGIVIAFHKILYIAPLESQ